MQSGFKKPVIHTKKYWYTVSIEWIALVALSVVNY